MEKCKLELWRTSFPDRCPVQLLHIVPFSGDRARVLVCVCLGGRGAGCGLLLSSRLPVFIMLFVKK